MKKNKKILLIYAHPSQHRSEVNQRLFNAAKSLDFVTSVDLYMEYPTFQININKEQDRLLKHDVVIFQFPLYWYSTPAILKEWQDLVLEHNFAYGQHGKSLHGKLFFCATTMGGSKAAYQTDGYNHFTIRELLRPLEQTANLTGMKYLPPYALFGSRTAVEENRVSSHVENWKKLLAALHHDNIDLTKTSTLNYISNDIDELINSTFEVETSNG